MFQFHRPKNTSFYSWSVRFSGKNKIVFSMDWVFPQKYLMTTDWKGGIPLHQLCCLLTYQLAHDLDDLVHDLCSSFKTTNKHDIISGGCRTCVSWLRSTGLVGCHGYPPQTFWWAPRVRWDGREGRRLSLRPLHRTDWRWTGNRSQRAPIQNLWGDERKQTTGQCAGSQYIPCSADAAASTIPTLEVSCARVSPEHAPSPLLAKPHTRIVFQWEPTLRLHFLQYCLLSASCEPLLPWWLYRYHHIQREERYVP